MVCACARLSLKKLTGTENFRISFKSHEHVPMHLCTWSGLNICGHASIHQTHVILSRCLMVLSWTITLYCILLFGLYYNNPLEHNGHSPEHLSFSMRLQGKDCNESLGTVWSKDWYFNCYRTLCLTASREFLALGAPWWHCCRSWVKPVEINL